MALLGVEAGELLDARAEGGTEEFDRLYRRWRADLVALCRRSLGRRCDAEDAAQEAFLRAWLARDQYVPAEPYWPWLATIARRLCIDWQRRAAGELRDQDALDVEVVEITPERIVVAAEDLQIVFTALGELRPRERRGLLRRQLEGWSYREIAAADGATVESVRGSLKRARAALRRSALHDEVFCVGFGSDDGAQQRVTRRLGERLSSG